MDYDRDLVVKRAGELVAHYIHTKIVRDNQNRTTWTCPECGKNKFSLQKSTGAVGCWTPSCPIPKSTDPVGLVAHFEGLDYKKQFPAVLRKTREILGIEVVDSPKQTQQENTGGPQRRSEKQSGPPSPPGGSGDSGGATESSQSIGKDSSPQHDEGQAQGEGDSSARRRRSRPSGWRRSEPQEVPIPPPEKALPPLTSEDLQSAVFDVILKMCLPTNRDMEFWASRGVEPQTVIDGDIGSMSSKRCAEVVTRLEKIFGAHRLATIPGFWCDKRGKFHFTLDGDYTLIPYYDGEGRIRTIEGRYVGENLPEGKGKYVSLLRGGSHLYVYPNFSPQELVAFCEGPIGAIVAAQQGLAVGAIQGYQRYRKGGERAVLPELDGVDFAGRQVAYIPDLDVKPGVREGVEAEAPKAVRWLIEEAGGEARIARLPEEEGAKDLDEWLLSIDGEHRGRRFEELLEAAVSPEQWVGQTGGEQRLMEEPLVASKDDDRENSKQQEPRDSQPPEDSKEGKERQSTAGGEQAESGAHDDHPECPSGEDIPEKSEEPQPQGLPSESSPTDRYDEGQTREIETLGEGARPATASGTTQAEEDEEENLAAPPEAPATLRWRALIEGEKGIELPGHSVPYRPPASALELPQEGFLTEDEQPEVIGYGVLGLIFMWIVNMVWSGWLGSLPEWMPQPPGAVTLIGGLPMAVFVGALVALLSALMIGGWRRRIRRHLLGEDRENA